MKIFFAALRLCPNLVADDFLGSKFSFDTPSFGFPQSRKAAKKIAKKTGKTTAGSELLSTRHHLGSRKAAKKIAKKTGKTIAGSELLSTRLHLDSRKAEKTQRRSQRKPPGQSQKETCYPFAVSFGPRSFIMAAAMTRSSGVVILIFRELPSTNEIR
jgi:hypothetical protein